MSYKIIALDLDDTLLNDERQISDFTRATLLECEEKGIHIVLATGRPNIGVKSVSDMIGLKDNYMLSYNGGQIIRNDETIFSMDITKAQLDMLYKLAVENDTCILTYTKDEILAYNKNEYAQIESDLVGMPLREVNDFTALTDTSYPKAMLVDNPEKIKTLQQKFADLEGMNVAISKPFFLEFVKSGVDKGQSLLRLGEILDIKVEEIVAFGDSYNDISMLEVAGTSVAVGNAVEDVKKICTHICDTNQNDGVAKYIKEHVNLK